MLLLRLGVIVTEELREADVLWGARSVGTSEAEESFGFEMAGLAFPASRRRCTK